MYALKHFILVVIRKGQVVFACIDRRWYEILFEGARTISQLRAACWALGTAGTWAALQCACGFCSPWYTRAKQIGVLKVTEVDNSREQEFNFQTM